MAKMPLAEHDNVVKTFPPDRTDRPFTMSVLPRRSRRGWPIPNAHRPKAADEDVTVEGVAVTNDVSRRYFPTTGLGELARNPFSRWVRGHSQPQDLAAIRHADGTISGFVGLADGVLTLPPRLPPGGFQRGYISQEDCLGSNPAKWRGFLYSNRRCGSSRVHLWLIRLSYARWEQAYFP
jgi:hypothetical protein